MNWITVHQSGLHTLKKLHAQVPQSWLSWTSPRRTVYHGVSRANLAYGWNPSIDWWMDRRIDQIIYEQHSESGRRTPSEISSAARSSIFEELSTRVFPHTWHLMYFDAMTFLNNACGMVTWHAPTRLAHMFQNRSHSNSGIIGSRRLVIHSVTMPQTKPNFLRRRTDGDLSATFYLQGLSPVPLEGAGLRPGGPIASRQKMKRASSNLSSFMRPMPLLPYQRGPESPVLPEVPPSNSIKVDVEVPESCLPNLKALQRRSTLPTLDLRSEALMLSRQLHLDFHEVKFVLQELRSESTLPTGGLDYTTFSQCLQRICGVELEDKWIGTAYKECHGSEGEIDSEQLLIWYRDHIFDLEACKRKRRFASGTAVPQVTLDLAKRFHCSCLDLDKVKVKFDDFDLDKSGYIDHYEFEKMLYQLLNCSSQSDFPKARLQRFWNEADKNGDGQIDFEEFLEWYMKYFGTTYENGPMDAFYASFMPVLQRSNSFGELKSHECCLQSIHVRWVEPWLGFHLHPASSLGGLSLKTQF